MVERNFASFFLINELRKLLNVSCLCLHCHPCECEDPSMDSRLHGNDRGNDDNTRTPANIVSIKLIAFMLFIMVCPKGLN